ncbi:MAG: imidazole glycerol phosphate synthase subunit HisF [Gemmatimonadaceae bacterium]
MTDLVIIDSGVANLSSVRGAFARLGVEATVSADADVVRRATRLVLPGVGAFGAGMAALQSRGLDDAVRDAVASGTPLLAICLGLQLLTDGSEESPGIRGLGVISGTCQRLPRDVRVPHLGWNRVDPDADHQLVAGMEAAFANSYALRESPPGWATAWTTHGVRFVSALERGAVLACQFHPELSGVAGSALLRRWLTHNGIEAHQRSTAATMPEALLPELPALRAAAATLRVDRPAEAASLHSATAPADRSPGLAVRLVPCLDVRDGRVVKGIQFTDLRDAGDPAEQAARYEDQGADEIVVLDIAASPEARETQLDTVRRVRAVLGIPLTVGGGVRSVEDARRLLAAGADKVSVNSAAVANPALIADLAREFGSQCVVLAVDARRAGEGWEVLVMGGRTSTGIDAVAWAREGTAVGAGEVLLTSWDRDGTRRGCDLELLRAVSGAVTVPVIASGGIGTREHVAQAVAAGAEAVLAASVFHDGDETVASIKADLAIRGVQVRR